LQVEYYLSVDNLIRDLWLREQMDAEGWVALAHIAAFKRMAMLTHAIGGDIGEIAAALSTSTEVGRASLFPSTHLFHAIAQRHTHTLTHTPTSQLCDHSL
jgi:hypothetical protein